MERFYLEEPTLERKQYAIEYIEEHYKYNSNINGSGSLHRYLKNNTYEEWLIKLKQDKNTIPTEERVPAETYFLVRENDNKIIGMINIRLVLNKRLKESGGHIGYGIRPTERNKGYNKINLYLGLLKCHEYNIEEVMLSCDKNNLGSKKTMISLGGVLDKEYYIEKEKIQAQNYIINVEESISKYKEVYEKHILLEHKSKLIKK